MGRHSDRLQDAIQELAIEVRHKGQVRFSGWVTANHVRLGYLSPVSLFNGIRNNLNTHRAFKPFLWHRGVLSMPPATPEDTGRGEIEAGPSQFLGPVRANGPRIPVRLSDTYMRSIAERLASGGRMADAGEAAIIADHLLELLELRKAAGRSVGEAGVRIVSNQRQAFGNLGE